MTAAEAILAARQARRVLPPLGPLAPPDDAAGYATQREVALALGAVPPAGFKIGATAKRMQAYLGIHSPLAGFVAAAGLLADGAVLRCEDFVGVGVECEIGIRLGADLPPGPCSRAAARAAIAAAFPAIEIVDQRYGDLAALGTPTLIADQVFHAAGVIGADAAGWPGVELAAARGRISVDGVVRGEGVGADLLGDPLTALAWLAGSGAAEVFGGLRAGQVVFLGSVTPPIWLTGPAEVRVVFDLLGEVAVRFR